MSVAPLYGQVPGAEDGETIPAKRMMHIAISGCVLVVFIGVQILTYFVTNWQCDANAPPSQYGLEFMPRDLTLDETAQGAFDTIRGRSVNVFKGNKESDRVEGEVFIGYFCKVYSWWGNKFGYVERTAAGDKLRFTAHQMWTWFHSPHVVTPCETGPIYEIAREGSIWGTFDGTFHNVWKRTSGGNVKIAQADHVTSGLDVGASLFQGVKLNIKWSVLFKAFDTPQTLVAAAYQWYNHNVIADFGSSNWAVNSKNKSDLPAGVEPLPAHIVGFVSGLYDLQTGSDRRRRSSSGHSGSFFSRRRR